MNQEKNRENTCLIVGLGAVGVTIAARTKLVFGQPALWGRSGFETRKFGFNGWDESLILQNNGSQLISGIKIVFVCVKSFVLESVLERICPDLSEGTVVIPVCNGAVDDIVSHQSKKHPKLIWRHGFCSFGTSHSSSGLGSETIEAGAENYVLRSAANSSQVIWGPVKSCANTQTEEYVTEVELAIINAKVKADSEKFFIFDGNTEFLRRRKWLFNSVMNTLCGVDRLETNGALLNDEVKLKAVYKEVYSLYQKLWGPAPSSEAKTWDELLEFVRATANNENSMAKDVRLRQKTETDFLAGMAMAYSGFPQLKSLHSKLLEF